MPPLDHTDPTFTADTPSLSPAKPSLAFIRAARRGLPPGARQDHASHAAADRGLFIRRRGKPSIASGDGGRPIKDDDVPIQRRRPQRDIWRTPLVHLVRRDDLVFRFLNRHELAEFCRLGDVPFVVSNIWWFDQVNAGTAIQATFLYVKDPAAARAALRQTSPAPVLLATSEESEFVTTLDAWTEGTCYVNEDRQALTERRVVLQRVECSAATTAKPTAR